MQEKAQVWLIFSIIEINIEYEINGAIFFNFMFIFSNFSLHIFKYSSI